MVYHIAARMRACLPKPLLDRLFALRSYLKSYAWPHSQDHKLPKLKWCHRVRSTEEAWESMTVVAAVGAGGKWETRRNEEFSTYPRSQQPPCGNQCTAAGVR